MILGQTNTGTSKTYWVGNHGSVEAWLNVSGITNIFIIIYIKKLGYHITYDSDDRYYLVTKRKTDVATNFIEDENGLPYVEATKEGVIFVHKFRQNYDGLTKKEAEKAVLACKSPGLIGHPSERYIKYLVRSKLENCPVTIPDVENSPKRFDPILGGVHGKTT